MQTSIKSTELLSDRVVLVTGAARGIGLGIAQHFARAGAKVFLMDINQAEIQKQCEILQDEGFISHPITCDVTNESEIMRALDLVKERYNRIDILVNNAGKQHVALIEDFPTQTFNEMIQLMLMAPFMLTKGVMPIMKEQKYGRIINIASINGLIGFAGKSAYNSAKHGVIGLTKVVALEGASHGITANAICPGYVDTVLVRGQFADLAKTRGTTPDRILEEVIFPLVPQKRLITIEEVAGLAVYLAGELASGITGQSMVVDGGYTVQ